MSETGDSGDKSKPDKSELLKPLSVRKVRFKVNKFLAEKRQGYLEQHFFSQKQVKFLEAYSETLDFKTACDRSGLKPHHIRKSEYLMNEIEHINKAAHYRHRSKSTLGKFHQFMDKVEKLFDNSTNNDMRKASMSTLARLHDTALRAAGEFTEKAENTGITGVRVSINIGPEPAKPETPPEVTIDVE